MKVRLWAEAPTALADGALEETAAERRGDEHAHRPRAGGLAHNRHAIRVAAKRRDVLPDPVERRNLVEEPVIAGRMMCRFGGQLGMRQIPEGSEPGIHRDEHDAFLREWRAVRRVADARPECPASTVVPDDHGPPLAGGGGGPDVQGQAIFALSFGRIGEGSRWMAVLRAGGADRVAASGAAPRLHRLRWLPAEVTDGRRRERNPLVAADAVSAHAGNQPAFDLDRGGGRGTLGFENRRSHHEGQNGGRRNSDRESCFHERLLARGFRTIIGRRGATTITKQSATKATKATKITKFWQFVILDSSLKSRIMNHESRRGGMRCASSRRSYRPSRLRRRFQQHNGTRRKRWTSTSSTWKVGMPSCGSHPRASPSSTTPETGAPPRSAMPTASWPRSRR